jgi:DNA invertase Pin-like site-specific DNA recombinase
MVVATKAPKRTGGIVPLDADTTALIYSRVSRDEQADEGVSLPAQVGEARRYNSRQPGWIAGEEFQDIESGRRDDRADYQRLLLAARGLVLEGKRAAVTVASLDRLGRNVAERVRAYEELKALGVTIHSAREGGVVSEFTYNILAAVAQEESRKLSERVRGSWPYFDEHGWHKPGSAPWGYRWRPATDKERRGLGAPRSVLEVHPDEAPYVREMWTRRASGESLQSIARWVAGLPAAVRGDRMLSYAAIRWLLLSPVYIARIGRDHDVATCEPTPSGCPVLAEPVGRWEPLIDDDIWNRIHDQYRLSKALPRQASGRYMLTGLLRCHRCGSRMVGRTLKAAPRKNRGGRLSKERRQYTCTGRMQGAKTAETPCQALAAAGQLETTVIEIVGELLAAAGRPETRRAIERVWQQRRQAMMAEPDGIRRIRRLERQLALTRRRIAGASKALLDGDMSRLAYDVTTAELQDELLAIEEELTRLRGRTRTTDLPPISALLAGVAGWASALQVAEPMAVRQALGTLIERVTSVNVARGKWEASITWSAIGIALLWTAVEVAPTPMLVAVEQSAQAPLKYGQTVQGVAVWRIWFGQQRVLPLRQARQRPHANA